MGQKVKAFGDQLVNKKMFLSSFLFNQRMKGCKCQSSHPKDYGQLVLMDKLKRINPIIPLIQLYILEDGYINSENAVYLKSPYFQNKSQKKYFRRGRLWTVIPTNCCHWLSYNLLIWLQKKAFYFCIFF